MVFHVQENVGKDTHDVIAMGLADLSVWCFTCDEYITHPKLEDTFRIMHQAKFYALPSSQLHVSQDAAPAITMMLDIREKDTEEGNAAGPSGCVASSSSPVGSEPKEENDGLL